MTSILLSTINECILDFLFFLNLFYSIVSWNDIQRCLSELYEAQLPHPVATCILHIAVHFASTYLGSPNQEK